MTGEIEEYNLLLFGAVELQKYNSYCSDFNLCIIAMHELKKGGTTSAR